VTKRIRRDAEESRDNILSAAEGLIRDAGPRNFKLAEVARRAGTTHSNVIAHFGSVLELQRQTASRIAQSLIGDIANELTKSDMGVEPVRHAVTILFAAFAREENRSLFAWIILHDETGELPGLTAGLSVISAIMQERLRVRGKQASANPHAVGRIMRLVIGAAMGTALTARYLEGLGPSDSNDQANAMAELLYNSFG
jgi:AcrR family transcriptional regulator